MSRNIVIGGGGGWSTAASSVYPSNAQFHDLWSDHVYLTEKVARDILFQALTSVPMASSIPRLLTNQDQIGAALGIVYGEAVGRAVTQLLREHIQLALPIVQGAWRMLARPDLYPDQAKEKEELNKANAAWDANGQQIAAALHSVDPRSFPLQAMEQHMQTHLDTTRAYVLPLMKREFAESQRKFDIALEHMRHFATLLYEGTQRHTGQQQQQQQ